MSDASRAWTWRHAFSASDLPATTKHVLHTLGMFMNELGEGCYPSIANIVEYSGLDKKTVRKHLDIARETGWIAVSQHGFRGQRWKRNEYAARWPERDLIAACPPVDEPETGEGGGASPPPSGVEKVGEMVPEGGGIEGTKVGEPVPQDKTSPENIPVTSPVERERAREDFVEEKPKRSRQQSLRLFNEGFKLWPNRTDSPSKAERAWKALTEDEQDVAIDRIGDFIELRRSEGRSHFQAFSTYIIDRLWTTLPDKAAEPERTHVPAPPFGKLWGLAWLMPLYGTPEPGRFKPPDFVAQKMAEPGEDGRRHRLRWQALHGWPQVNRMFERLRQGGLTLVPAELEALDVPMAQLRTDGPVWAAWQAECERRGWPFPEKPWPQWAWMPAGPQDDEPGDQVGKALVLLEEALNRAGMHPELQKNEEGNTDDGAAA